MKFSVKVNIIILFTYIPKAFTDKKLVFKSTSKLMVFAAKILAEFILIF